eukprot:5110974-Pleurochrysis_carterae.AAC.2
MQRNPNMRVKVANGVTLPVKFIGFIVLRILAVDVRNGHDGYSNVETTLELRDALYVPGLCANLLSTKGMLKMQGIRTYLNDEVRHVLPNGNHVRIRKTTAKYTITLSTYTSVHAVTLTGENDTVERGRGRRIDGQFKNVLHARLGHLAIDCINAFVKQVRGIEEQLRSLIQTVVFA